MTVLVTLAAMLAPAPVAPVDVAATAAPPRPALVYSNAGRRRARRQLAAARWYLRRHRATRPYRQWLRSTRGCETRGQAAPYATATGNGLWCLPIRPADLALGRRPRAAELVAAARAGLPRRDPAAPARHRAVAGVRLVMRGVIVEGEL